MASYYLTEGETLEEALRLITADQHVYLVVPQFRYIRLLMDRACVFLDAESRRGGLTFRVEKQQATRITFQNGRLLIFISSPVKEKVRGVRAAAFETTDRNLWVRIDGPGNPDFNRRLVYQTRYERLG